MGSVFCKHDFCQGPEAEDATKAGEGAEGDLDDEDIPDMDGGSSMAIERMDDLVDLDGMTVGHVVQGYILFCFILFTMFFFSYFFCYSFFSKVLFYSFCNIFYTCI